MFDKCYFCVKPWVVLLAYQSLSDPVTAEDFFRLLAGLGLVMITSSSCNKKKRKPEEKIQCQIAQLARCILQGWQFFFFLFFF